MSSSTAGPLAIIRFNPFSLALHFKPFGQSICRKYPFQHAGVGHSIGQCIGAYFADPEKAKSPGVMFIGDAGFVLACYDLETMVPG